jgi:transposase
MITQLYEQLANLVKQTTPHLLADRGLGVLIAAKLIGEIAGIDRFTSDAQLARISGCAPIPVSSGRTDRHRLDPGGLNHALHMLALTKLLDDPRTAVYMAEQRTNGKTSRDAIRSLNAASSDASTTYVQLDWAFSPPQTTLHSPSWNLLLRRCSDLARLGR